MKIIEEPKVFTVFSELYPGDVFNYNGLWYMKIAPIQIKDLCLNAVALCDGVPEHIAPESSVDYQDVELRVKEVQ